MNGAGEDLKIMKSEKVVRMHYRRSTCRLCKRTHLVKLLDLGKQPIAGEFLTREEFASEKFYPLQLYICKDCFLVQVLDVIDKEILFKEYFYLSSVSRTLSQHFVDYAELLRDRFMKPPSPFLVEIGCNDGVLLKPLNAIGIRTLGFEPAINIAKVAREAGIDVVNDFFTEKTAEKVAESRGRADVITASNVFAHIDDLDDVMRGIKILMKEDGVFVIEVHYLLSVIEELQYDVIYHEHMNYYSLRPLIEFFRNFDMEIFDVQRTPMHAGGLRVFVRNVGRRGGPVLKGVAELYDLERKAGLYDVETYMAFSAKVMKSKDDLLRLLLELKAQGHKIVGYGASGRGITILNYCGVGPTLLDYVVDASPLRQGRFMPGTHLPIVSEEVFRKDNAGYAVLLAWSYADEILGKEKAFLERGGRFIVPLPQVRMIP